MVLFHALFGLPEYKGPKTKDHFSFYQFLVAEITVKLDVLLGSLLIWLESKCYLMSAILSTQRSLSSGKRFFLREILRSW